MFTEFMDAWAIAQAEQEIFIAALPQWVQWWMNWMTIILGPATLVAALFRVEARWLLLAMLLTIPSTMVMGIYVGWSGLWGLIHIVFWTPVAIYMTRRFSQTQIKSLYGLWYVLVLATLWISLVFDVKDVGAYLFG